MDTRAGTNRGKALIALIAIGCTVRQIAIILSANDSSLRTTIGRMRNAGAHITTNPTQDYARIVRAWAEGVTCLPEDLEDAQEIFDGLQRVLGLEGITNIAKGMWLAANYTARPDQMSDRACGQSSLIKLLTAILGKNSTCNNGGEDCLLDLIEDIKLGSNVPTSREMFLNMLAETVGHDARQDIVFDHNNAARELVESLIDALPKEEVTIIRLRFFENKSFPEAAAIMNVATQRAYQLSGHAIRKLRKPHNVEQLNQLWRGINLTDPHQ